MIFGVGTDLVRIARLRDLYERHGQRAIDRILAPPERDEFAAKSAGSGFDAGRFLAKRFAAKEAFAKAVGTGVRAPWLLTAIAVVHDDLGKPALRLFGAAAAQATRRGWRWHLSISDESDVALAFVVIEEER